MKDKIYYYDRNNVLRLTLNEWPYYSEPSDLKDWIWGFNEQFGKINSFRRNKQDYQLVIGIDGDYPSQHDALCDIFSADVLANEPGYLMLRGWKLPCYIIEAEYEYFLKYDRKAVFKVRSINSTWIRSSIRSYDGVPGGGLAGEDFGRDYIYAYTPPKKYEGSGEIVQIKNDDCLVLTSLVTTLSPIQSLNGYDSPWVGGAGKNKLPYPYTESTVKKNGITFTVNSDGSVKVNGTATANTYFHYCSNIITALGLQSGDSMTVTDGVTYDASSAFSRLIYVNNNAGLTRIQNSYTLNVTADMVSRGLRYELIVSSGVTVSNKVFYPMIRLASETDATYEPYSNICPISGWDEVNVQRTGKNLFDENYPNIDGSMRRVYIQTGNGTFTLSTTAQAVNGAANLFFQAGQVTSGESTSSNGVYSGRPRTVTTTDGYVTIGYRIVNGTTDAGNPLKCKAQLEIGSTPTTYEPYQGTTYTTDLGRTVYGGKLDVVSGVLTVTDGYIASYNSETLPSTWISDRDVYASGTKPTTGAQVVYKLATPQTYQLTPKQVGLLSGDNSLWADTSGQIDVLYETKSVPFPARGYIYGYSQPESHYDSIDLPGTGNGYEIMIYGPQVNPVIYLDNQPIQVNVTLEATERLHIVSNGSVKTIEILQPNGAATDAFVYRDKEHSPFLTLGQHTDLTFGQIRFDFTTIERRSEPTWT